MLGIDLATQVVALGPIAFGIAEADEQIALSITCAIHRCIDYVVFIGRNAGVSSVRLVEGAFYSSFGRVASIC